MNWPYPGSTNAEAISMAVNRQSPMSQAIGIDPCAANKSLIAQAMSEDVSGVVSATNPRA
jgi:hypothetical protein